MVSHLKELLVVSGLSVPQLAGRLALTDLRPLYSLRNNESKSYDFDLLARVCAIFDSLPLSTLLEYVAPGAEPSARYQQRAVLAALPSPYGGIRCLILGFLGDYITTEYFEQIADATRLHWTTLAKLANYKSRAVRTSTLAALCGHFGGIERVFVYEPEFSWPEKT